LRKALFTVAIMLVNTTSNCIQCCPISYTFYPYPYFKNQNGKCSYKDLRLASELDIDLIFGLHNRQRRAVAHILQNHGLHGPHLDLIALGVLNALDSKGLQLEMQEIFRDAQKLLAASGAVFEPVN
jgi:hypothetical protein